jgi:hypothetical protein
MKELLKKNTKEGNLDISTVLVDMEKKVNKKFSAYDEIFKTFNDGSTKFRTELTMIKKQIEDLKLLKNNEKTAGEFFAINNVNEINDDKDYFDLNNTANNQKDSSPVQNNTNTIDIPFDSNRTGDDVNPIKSNKSVDYNKILRDMTKKIQELDKNYHSLSSSLNPEIIKAELTRLNEIAEKRLGDNQVSEIRNSLSKCH